MKYIFYYKRYLFWKKETVIGHGLNNDVMTLYFEDGSIRTITKWHNYSLRLKTDWVLSVKKKMEEESGTSINLKVNP